MKAKWALLLLFTVAGYTLSAFAGSPTMGVLDPNCGHPYDVGISNPNPTNVSLGTFSSNATGGGLIRFCNQSFNTWTSLQFSTTNFNSTFPLGSWTFNTTGQVSGTGTAPVVCNVGSGSTQAFLQCSVTVTASNFLLRFFGTNALVNGIGSEEIASVNLNTDQSSISKTGIGDWLSNGHPVSFSGVANAPTPEPTTLLLLGSGLAGIAFRMRKSKRT